MPGFNFSGLIDLDLSIKEMYAINQIWSKQKVNQEFWKETPQVFIENFVRCLRSAIPCNAVPSVVAAQGILESGWFSTNSLFGVKATKLQTQEHVGTAIQTHEIVGKLSVPTVADFFVTPSIQQNFANYYDYVRRMKPDSDKFIPSNSIGYLTYLQAEPAYSSAGSRYIDSMMSVVTSNGLTAFDHS